MKIQLDVDTMKLYIDGELSQKRPIDFRIYLDGVLQKQCFEADTVAGYVVIYKTILTLTNSFSLDDCSTALDTRETKMVPEIKHGEVVVEEHLVIQHEN